MTTLDSLSISLAILTFIRVLGMLVFVDLYFQKREGKYLVLVLGWLVVATGSAWGLYTHAGLGEMENYYFSLLAGFGSFLIGCGALLYFDAIRMRFVYTGGVLILLYGLLPLFDLRLGPSPGVIIQLLISLLVTFVALFRRKVFWDFARSSYFWLVAMAVLSDAMTIVFGAGWIGPDSQAVGFAGTIFSQIIAIIFFLHLEYSLSSRRMLEKENRYRFLFEFAPVALWEEDISSLLKIFSQLKNQGVGDLRQYLDDNPAFLQEALQKLRVVDVNREALVLHKASTKEGLIASLADTFLPESYLAFSDAVISLFDEYPEYERETLVQTLQGEPRHVIMRIHTRFSDSRFPRSLVSMTDISGQKKAEKALLEYSEKLEEMVAKRTQELEAAQESLVNQERLAVLGALAGGVSQELRNPLSVITNAVYFLNMALKDADAKTREYLDLMEVETQNATQIVSGLLDFAGIRSLERSANSVLDVVETAVHQSQAPENVTVKIDIAEYLPRVLVDPRQIRQAVKNLVVNAYQAMQSGGQLTIRAYQVQGKIVISVSDTGPGIPTEHMDKLFEPLFTTKARGIGLGLAIAKRLVEANQGRIEVESKEGVGSTFTVILPIFGE